MTKLLIVAGERMHTIWLRALTEFFTEIKAVSHQDALGEFLTWEPTHVFVDDYYEHEFLGERTLPDGWQTWQDLQAATTGIERMIRCSLEKHEYPDFIRLPFLLEALRDKFFPEG